MERIKELRMTAIILLMGIFLLSGCFFSSKNEVTFKTNGGSEVKSASVKSGNKIDVPETPTKEGYVFEGWYLNGKEYNFDDEVNEDITLVAKWRKVDVDGEDVKDDNNDDDNDNNEEDSTTKATTKKVTTKKTTASGTIKKTTTTKKKTTNSMTTTTKKIEETTKPTEPIVPVEPTKPIEPVKPTEPVEPTKPTEPIEPVTPENKELKMNITITEEIISSMVVESKNTDVLEVIKENEESKEEIEEVKKKYNLVIDLNSENVNTVSNLAEEDLNELLSGDITKWQINNQMGNIFELDIKDNKISSTTEEEIKVLTIKNVDKAYVVTFDEDLQKWVIDYPSVMVTNEENAMYYANLNDAMKTVVSGNKVTILRDLDSEESIIIDKAITIDGGSFKITSSSEYLFNIKDIDDEMGEIILNNMEVKVKSLLRVENLKVKSITVENIKGTYENKIMDNQSWLEIVENNLKLDFLEIKEEKELEEKTL